MSDKPIHPHLSTSIIEVIPNKTPSAAEQALNKLVSDGPLGRGNADFAAVLPVLQHLQRQKGIVYGDSWKKRGEHYSIFPNLCRKWDRLEQIMLREAQGHKSPEQETKVDTVADLAVYCILWLTELAQTDPEAFLKFLAESARLNNE